MRQLGATAALGLVIVTVAACSQGFRPSTISTGPDGLRTFSVINEANGTTIACAAFGLTNPVSGILDGQAGARDPIWLRTPDGRQLAVVWPEGFNVRFEPAAVLRDEKGTVVALAGQRVELGQVRPESHAGSFEDPYIASGILFKRCYPFVLEAPPPPPDASP
jgi:hypothetical protein